MKIDRFEDIQAWKENKQGPSINDRQKLKMDEREEVPCEALAKQGIFYLCIIIHL